MLLVAVGGALGAVARWLVQEWLLPRSIIFPTSTFVINVSGCFLIGAFVAAAAGHAGWPEELRLLFPIGFVGAYTTFSSYQLQLFQLIERGAWGTAAAYFTGSNLAGFAGVALGVYLGKRIL